MKISFNWLKEYVSLPAEVGPAEVAKKLTFAGLEVEAVTSLAKGFDKVVVGQILERNKHPQADRLSLTKIDVGTGAPLEIVCGAQNIAAGQKIPVATVGAVIPNGLEIKPAKIRGVPSQGMLCSLDELLLPKEWQAEDGIFQLSADAKIGTPLADYLGLNDTILEINVTPNRGDALSHFGVARDVAALFGSQAKLPEVKVEEKEGGVPVSIHNAAGPELCPAYYGRYIEKVKIAPSPAWLRKKLEAIGLRSINNVVDVTAFVMMEMGQPLHAFDADKLIGKGKDIAVSIGVAMEGEEFETLTEKKVTLKEGDLLIGSGDSARAVALAGVMGGKNSEVDDNTANVFLEAAEFNPVRVRKTGRRLGLLTDAGYRFERGVDSSRVKWALDRATDLIVQLSGGVAHGAVQAPEAAKDESPGQIRLQVSEIQRLLGKAPDLQSVIQILRGLNITCEVAAGEQGVVMVQIPRWRKDIKRAVDLIEEVARIWGFDQLESRLPLGGFGDAESTDTRRRSYFQVRRVRRHLASLGFFEALNYGFSSPDVLEKAHGEEELKGLVRVANPVTSDYSVMKPSLVTGLLQNVQQNFAHRARNLRFFEVRRTFAMETKAPKEADPRTLTGIEESVHLALLMTGAEVDETWEGKPQPVDFYSIKGALESVFELLGTGGLSFKPGTDKSFLHPGQSATILVGNRAVGCVGRVHPGVEKRFEIEQDAFYAELYMDALVKDDVRRVQFKEYSKFPEVERDFSALVKDDVNAAMIRAAVTKAAKPLLQDFLIFDVYRGTRVPEGHVSYAFRVTLGAADHTLTDTEITGAQNAIMKALEKDFGAKFAGLS
jgi:phenylalanyl-tRNA synthetase beta chain